MRTELRIGAQSDPAAWFEWGMPVSPTSWGDSLSSDVCARAHPRTSTTMKINMPQRLWNDAN